MPFYLLQCIFPSLWYCAVTLFICFTPPYELFDCARLYELFDFTQFPWLFDYTGSGCFLSETYTTRVYNLFLLLTSLGVLNCTRYFVPLARSLAYNIGDSILFSFWFQSYYFCTCQGVFLSRRAVPLSFIFICSCSRKLYLRLRWLTRIPTRLGSWYHPILSLSYATQEACTFKAYRHAKAFLQSHWSSPGGGLCSST